MTQDEAIKKLESWLLIPIDYESILPALYAIRNTTDFKSYVSKVADAEFKPEAEVLHDVEAYEEEAARKAEAVGQMLKKLNEISGGLRSDGSKKKDVFDDLEKAHREKTEEEIKQERADERFKAYTKKYMAKQSNTAGSDDSDRFDHYPVPCCPYCHRPMIKKEVFAPLTCGTIALACFLGMFFLPLAFIPLFYGRKKVLTDYCEHCKKSIQ